MQAERERGFDSARAATGQRERSRNVPRRECEDERGEVDVVDAEGAQRRIERQQVPEPVHGEAEDPPGMAARMREEVADDEHAADPVREALLRLDPGPPQPPDNAAATRLPLAVVHLLEPAPALRR